MDTLTIVKLRLESLFDRTMFFNPPLTPEVLIERIIETEKEAGLYTESGLEELRKTLSGLMHEYGEPYLVNGVLTDQYKTIKISFLTI